MDVLARAVAAEALLRSLADPVPPAPSGRETVVSLPFSFDSPFPIVLQAIMAGQLLDRAALLIEVMFDDPAATAELGTTTDPGEVFNTSDVDLGVLGQYENRILTRFLFNDFLVFSIAPGTSTRGSGILLYKLK